MTLTMALPMSLISRLQAALHDAFGPAETRPDEAELTLAALLILVSRIDGQVLKVEESGVRRLLQSRFGLGEEGVARLLEQVDRMGEDVDQVATLSDRILHDVSLDERPRVLAMAYRMAALDGFLHEFEEDLIWRIGRLLGQSESEISAIREEALRNLAPERARLA